VQKAGEKLDVAKMSDKERAIYEKNKSDFMDYKSEIYTAETKGKLAGIAEANKATAQKLKAKGMSAEEISDITGLSKAEIESLQ